MNILVYFLKLLRKGTPETPMQESLEKCDAGAHWLNTLQPFQFTAPAY
jgi:hypothetical protein